jgi:hypothetical protein
LPARSNSSARSDFRTAVDLGASASDRSRASIPAPDSLDRVFVLCFTYAAGRIDPYATALPQRGICCGQRSRRVRPTPLHTVVCGPTPFAPGGEPAGADRPIPVQFGGPPLETLLPRTARVGAPGLDGSSWIRQRGVEGAPRSRALVTMLALSADWQDRAPRHRGSGAVPGRVVIRALPPRASACLQ